MQSYSAVFSKAETRDGLALRTLGVRLALGVQRAFYHMSCQAVNGCFFVFIFLQYSSITCEVNHKCEVFLTHQCPFFMKQP